MAIRTRLKQSPPTYGTYRSFNVNGSVLNPGETHGPYISQSDECTDEVGKPGQDHILSINHYDRQIAKISGYTTYTGGQKFREFEGLDPSFGLPAFVHPSIPTPATSSLINRSNPARPNVDLPVFLFELKDLPGMLKEAQTFGKQLPRAMELIQAAGRQLLYGRNRTKRIAEGLAGASLSYNLGWQPLVSDLMKMLNLADDIERRMKQLQSLNDPRGYSKKVQIGNVTLPSMDNSVTLTQIFGGWANVRNISHQEITSEKWAVIKYKRNFPGLPVDASWAGATRSLLGLSLSPASVWNIIPFSFAVDYFVDVGGWLEQFRNSIEARPVSATIMQHSKITRTITVTTRNWVGTGGNGTITRELKSRSILNLGLQLPAFTPFLSGRQVSNLASLSVARRSSWRN